MGFTGLDYLILILYLAGTVAFGTYLGRGNKDINDYFLGGRKMPWWAISFSIVATETSTLTFIGAPAIAYAGNLAFLQVAVGYLMGKVLVSFVLIPGYFRGEIQTAYEILNERFGGRVRRLSALLFQTTRMLADGVRLFATALVLGVVTQMSDVTTIVVIGLATILYTYYGGMTAVVWNDVIQLLIYLVGAGIAFYLILERIPGGWPEVAALAAPDQKLQWIDFRLDFSVPYTFWSGLIGGAFLTFATHGTDQMMVQRYIACGDRRKSQLALIVSGVFVIFQFLLFLMIGVLLFAFYHHFPMATQMTQNDQIFPIFIVEQIPSGVSGFIIAAVFAAGMSSLSSSLNSLASSAINDFYRPFFKPGADSRHYLRVSRFLTLMWGVLLMGVAFLARSWGDVLEVGLTITSITMGSILGIFLLGTLTRRTRETAGLAAMASGLAAMLGVVYLTSLAWPWYVLVGTLVTFAAGLTAERILQGLSSEEGK